MSDTISQSRPIVRKVLRHERFGLCVLLPKTDWARLTDSGPAQIVLDGAACWVTVCVEDCDCRSEALHQHRFLALPGSAEIATGRRVYISLAPT
jgi:hypothetical protein